MLRDEIKKKTSNGIKSTINNNKKINTKINTKTSRRHIWFLHWCEIQSQERETEKKKL